MCDVRHSTIKYTLAKCLRSDDDGAQAAKLIETAVKDVNLIVSRGTDLLYTHVLMLLAAHRAKVIDMENLCQQLGGLIKRNVIMQALEAHAQLTPQLTPKIPIPLFSHTSPSHFPTPHIFYSHVYYLPYRPSSSSALTVMTMSTKENGKAS